MSAQSRGDAQGRSTVGLWSLLIGVALVLYVFSSGPTRTVAFHVRSRTSTVVGGAALVTATVEVDEWWTTAYAPLGWISRQPWGEPLNWYWQQFPLR